MEQNKLSEEVKKKELAEKVEKKRLEFKEIVLSSSGGTSKHGGGRLGQYCYDSKNDWYVQKNTQESEEMYVRRYLFSLDGVWGAGNKPRDKAGWLYNPSKSKTLPLTGWWFHDGRSWCQDPSLVITKSPMTPLCDNVKVRIFGEAAKKWPLCQGVFTRTEMWWHGRPVFRNSDGQLLHQSPEQGWSVGAKLGFACITGSISHHCPTNERKWKYWDRSQYLPAKVDIDCKFIVLFMTWRKLLPLHWRSSSLSFYQTLQCFLQMLLQETMSSCICLSLQKSSQKKRCFSFLNGMLTLIKQIFMVKVE